MKRIFLVALASCCLPDASLIFGPKTGGPRPQRQPCARRSARARLRGSRKAGGRRWAARRGSSGAPLRDRGYAVCRLRRLPFAPARPAALRPILWMKSSRHAQAHSHQTLIACLHDNAATIGATPPPADLQASLRLLVGLVGAAQERTDDAVVMHRAEGTPASEPHCINRRAATFWVSFGLPARPISPRSSAHASPAIAITSLFIDPNSTDFRCRKERMTPSSIKMVFPSVRPC